jgi:hypothetical protein
LCRKKGLSFPVWLHLRLSRGKTCFYGYRTDGTDKVNWCQPNRTGIARLDNYFDPNERRYFITPESVRLALEEEKAKAQKGEQGLPAAYKDLHSQPENRSRPLFGKEQNASEEVAEPRKAVMDLKIANRGKDLFIEQLSGERADFVEKLIASSRKVGVLETKLLQLGTPEIPKPGENGEAAR